MFKYLKLLGMFKDVRKVYEEEKGKPKPWYASRRFLGAVFMFVAAALKVFLDVTVPPDLINELTDNVGLLADAINIAIPTVMGIYGAAVTLVGILKRSKSDGNG